MNNYIKDNYIGYDNRVIEFLNRVYNDCLNNNKDLSNFFYCCLDLLAVQLSNYYFAVDTIKSLKDCTDRDNYGRMSKNPIFSLLSTSHKQILDLLDKLALSPFAAAKVKRLNNGTDDAESAQELLDNLIN